MRKRLQQLRDSNGRLAQRAGGVGDNSEERIGHARVQASFQGEASIGILVHVAIDCQALGNIPHVTRFERDIPGKCKLKTHGKLLAESMVECRHPVLRRGPRSQALPYRGEQAATGSRRLREAAGKGIGQAIESRKVIIERGHHLGGKAEAILTNAHVDRDIKNSTSATPYHPVIDAVGEADARSIDQCGHVKGATRHAADVEETQPAFHAQCRKFRDGVARIIGACLRLDRARDTGIESAVATVKPLRSCALVLETQTEVHGQAVRGFPVILHIEGIVLVLCGARSADVGVPSAGGPEQKRCEVVAAVLGGSGRIRPLREDTVESEKTSGAIWGERVGLADLVTKAELDRMPSQGSVDVYEGIELIDVGSGGSPAGSQVLYIPTHFESRKGREGDGARETGWKSKRGKVETFSIHDVRIKVAGGAKPEINDRARVHDPGFAGAEGDVAALKLVLSIGRIPGRPTALAVERAAGIATMIPAVSKEQIVSAGKLMVHAARQARPFALGSPRVFKVLQIVRGCCSIRQWIELQGIQGHGIDSVGRDNVSRERISNESGPARPRR